MRKWISVAAACLSVGLIAALFVPAALAKGGDVRVAGKCTNSSTSKLKLSPDNGRIEVEFEVDQNRNGVKWTVVIRQNGKVVRTLKKVTKAPSGSFEVRYVAANKAAGKDSFVVKGTRNGETCTARASL